MTTVPATYRTYLPGLITCFALGLVAWGLAGLATNRGISGISAVFIAVVGGLLLHPVVGTRARLRPGIKIAATRVLKIGIVLLGLRFDLASIAAIGLIAIIAIVAVILGAFATSLLLGKALGIPTRLSLLIAIGTAICGNSAIAAAAPVLEADEEEIAFSSATITMFGTVALFALPALGVVMGLTDEQFGLLAGAGVHDSGQAVATGFAFSAAAGAIATLVKLARTTFLIPLLVALPSIARRTLQIDAHGARAPFPWFAVGFVLLATSRTLAEMALPIRGPLEQAITAAGTTAMFLIVVSLVGIALSTSLSQFRRVGPRLFVLGCAATVTVTGLAGVVAMTLR